MQVKRVRIESEGITDWESFHEVLAEALGFPDFYGRNGDALIDCLSYVDDPEAGMMGITVGPNEVLRLEVADSAGLRRRLPGLIQELEECTEVANNRCWNRHNGPVIDLVFL